MAFEHILFDLDGTLTDSYEGIAKCVQYALHYYGIEENNEENLKRFIGPPLWESFHIFYDFPEEKAKEAVLKYRERYHTVGVYENKVTATKRYTLPPQSRLSSLKSCLSISIWLNILHLYAVRHLTSRLRTRQA